MAQPVIQTSFNSGEWAPALNARVDLAKYHSGASLLRNFFVDYRGGATTRPGSKYILQAKSNSTVRLIPFQASFTVTYMLEFGQNYIRFFSNGSPVLEAQTFIQGVTNANPGVVTDNGHGYSNGDWIYISNVSGMTQLNGNYYIVQNVTANTFTLTDLNGVAINTTSYGVWSAGGNPQRVYTIASPYLATDVNSLKYCQDVNTLILCHPDYGPYQLVLTSATSWTLSLISFGATISAPTGQAVATSLGAGSVNYAYVITAVDANGQESGPSAYATLASKLDLRSTAGTNTISWTAVSGAASYNVYKAQLSYSAAVPAGAEFGYIGNCTSNSFIDSNIGPDYTITPPIAENPFQGAGLQSVTVTAGGVYTSVPTATVAAAPSGGQTATVQPTCGIATTSFSSGGSGHSIGDILPSTSVSGCVIQVTNVSAGVITAWIVLVAGAFTSGSLPTTVTFKGSSGGSIVLNTTWAVNGVNIINAGAGYTTTPAITFSSGAAAATAVLAAAAAGNPTVPMFIQQRLFLGGPEGSPSQYNLSQPGSPYNFNVTNPVQADNAISATLSNTILNSIVGAVSVSAGLVVITDKGAWLINGGSAGAPISAEAIVANPQAYSGGNDLPPIVTPNDILYVQAKGSVVRDLAYNFYLNNYVGADISIISSHLFYGYTLTQWCWAEEPYKLAWAIRSDGKLLSLTFLKEQELIAWSHHDTNGTYMSIASVNEAVSFGNVDAVYTVVTRTINGNTVNYIERFTELYYTHDYQSAWQVDAGIQYSGSPAISFSGAQHLAGASVVGLADGIPFTATVSSTGTFTLGTAASLVTVGLAFTPQLGTLPVDLGEPTVQGKRKSVSAVNVRVANTLGLSAGKASDFSDQKTMKDLVLGNVGTQSNAVVTGLVTSDARIVLPPQYDVFGSYYFQQSQPYPATILGVMPEITVGDTPK